MTRQQSNTEWNTINNNRFTHRFRYKHRTLLLYTISCAQIILLCLHSFYRCVLIQVLHTTRLIDFSKPAPSSLRLFDKINLVFETNPRVLPNLVGALRHACYHLLDIVKENTSQYTLLTWDVLFSFNKKYKSYLESNQQTCIYTCKCKELNVCGSCDTPLSTPHNVVWCR